MGQTPNEMQTKMTTRAQAVLDAMAKREYRNAIVHFDTTMTSLMPADKVEELWTAIVEKVGPFEKVVSTRAETVKGSPVVVLVSKFEKATLDLNVTFDASANISGLHVALDQAQAKPTSSSSEVTARGDEASASTSEAPAKQ